MAPEFNGATNFSETDSALADSNESDGSRNYQINLNGSKWLKDNLKFKSTFITEIPNQIMINLQLEKRN